jgi:hypothetical protein
VGLYMPAIIKYPLKNGRDRWKKIIQYSDFKCCVDGKKVERVLRKADRDKINNEYDYWFVTDLHFKACEKKRVINTYKQLPSGMQDVTMSHLLTSKYILKTGKLWKGSIGKASITFYIPFYLSSPFKIPQHPDNDVPHMYLLDDQSRIKNLKMVFDFAGSMSNEMPGYKMGRFSVWCLKEPEYISIEENYLKIHWYYTDFEPDFDIICTWGLDLHIGSMYMSCGPDAFMTENNKYGKHLNNKEFFYKLTLAAGAYVIHMCDSNYFSIAPVDTAKKEFERLILLSQFFVSSLYANRGYMFKDTEWTDFFSRYTWYNPVTTSPELTIEEKEAIELVKEKENYIRISFFSRLYGRY